MELNQKAGPLILGQAAKIVGVWDTPVEMEIIKMASGIP
jgi:hypothetical protein